MYSSKSRQRHLQDAALSNLRLIDGERKLLPIGAVNTL
jgi:hypothetical protein